MALQVDPSGVPRLVGDNTSESVNLSVVNSRFGGVTNFPSGVWMLGGDDTVFGSAIGDFIFGNDGEDSLGGYFGNDSLFGGKGKDDLWGGDGNDYLAGGQDADWIRAGAGNDILLGGRGNDILYSGNGNDTLIGGVGRDYFSGVDYGGYSVKTSGSNLYVLQRELGVTDINKADFLTDFRVGLDRIGLTDGLTLNDVVLDNLTNVRLSLDFDFSKAERSIVSADYLNPLTFVTSGTLIKVRSSGEVIGFVDSVTPAQLQNSIISVQRF